jgi:hypothetical protein
MRISLFTKSLLLAASAILFLAAAPAEADKYDDLLAKALRASSASGGRKLIVDYAQNLKVIEAQHTAAAKDGVVMQAYSRSATNEQLASANEACTQRVGRPAPDTIDAIRRCIAETYFTRISETLDAALSGTASPAP